MKSINKISALLFITVACAFVAQPTSIVGSWTFQAPDGSENFMDFTDSTFTAHTPGGRIVNTGIYKVFDDIFFIHEENCGSSYWDKYIITFSGVDSLRFKLVEDDCDPRAQFLNGLGMKKVNK